VKEKMMTKKNKKLSDESVDTHEDEYAIDKLADAVADYWQEELENSEDPFDVYVHEKHVKICSDRHAFRGRLRRGYRSLLLELSESAEKSDENI
jgi:hypothetical protein